jgi:hypothetical protein
MNVKCLGLLLACASMPGPLAAQAALPWTVGSRVHANNSVYARTDTLGLGPKVLRVAGDKGAILGGPAGSSTTWGTSWLIHYDTPPDGWSTQLYLTLDTLAVPPPPQPPPVATAVPTLTVVPPALTLTAGVGGGLLWTVATDSGGKVIARSVRWTGTAPLVARVDSSGTPSTGAVVTALAAGTDTVTATNGLASARVVVFVTAAPVPVVRKIKRFGFPGVADVIPGLSASILDGVYFLTCTDSLGARAAQCVFTVSGP